MKLIWNLVYQDIKKNRIMSTVLTLFLLLSAILMAGGLRVTGTMLSATAGLNQAAVPPDYLRMHKGEYNAKKVQEFSDRHSYIKDSLVISMLNIDNMNIEYQGKTMENCLMDNGFVIQNSQFDFLLDMDNQIAKINDGEVGVPVYYHEELGIQVGDSITLKKGSYEKELKVVTLIRDAQMNAALTSSKRFLISENDQRELSEYMGEWEYSFEYLLEPGTETAVLESDYLSEDMPSNGVGVSASLINMINALSYGLIVFLLLAISLLLIIVALLCLSYIIRATLADEQRVIGTMKAIGLSLKSIERLYLMKYMTLTMIAGIIGYFLAIPFGKLCAASTILYCGEGQQNWMQWVYPALGIIILGFIVIFRCGRIIRKNLKSTVVELLCGDGSKRKEGHYNLPEGEWKCGNLYMAVGELFCKWKEYIVLFLVFVISAFLMILPMNMKRTVGDPSFITYMGVGKCDIRVDIQPGEHLEEDRASIQQYLKQDQEIEQFVMYQNGYVQVQNAKGEWTYLRVSSGDESVFPVKYLEGKAPNMSAKTAPTGEIALSAMEADELEKRTGDTIQVNYNGEVREYLITGIYQDVTYEGKTAKASIDFTKETVEGYVFYIKLKEEVPITDKADEIRQTVSGGRVTPIEEFVKQTLGGILGYVDKVVVAAFGLAVILIILITTMFLQLITAREHSAIAVKKSIGFTNGDIRRQFGLRVLIVQIGAMILGTLVANTLGETLFGILLSSAGAAKITMLINPTLSYFMCPVLQITICIMTVVSATRAVKNYHIRDQIME